MKWNQFFKKVRIGKSGWASFPILAAIVAGAVFFQSSGASSQPTQAALPCSLATLNGSYAFSNTGFLTEPLVNPNEFFPFTQIGSITFDGAGNTSGFGFLKDRNGLHKTGPSKGTYKVKSDCTGTLTGEEGVVSRLVIFHGGDEYYLIGPRKGVVGMGTAKKQ